MEDWIKLNNDRGDFLAGVVNQNRSPDLLSLQSEAIAQHVMIADRIWQLKSFYFQIAAQHQAHVQTAAAEVEIVEVVEDQLRYDPRTQ